MSESRPVYADRDGNLSDPVAENLRRLRAAVELLEGVEEDALPKGRTSWTLAMRFGHTLSGLRHLAKDVEEGLRTTKTKGKKGK